jgi:hypothetical protein
MKPKREDPYAILDDGIRRRPLRSLLAPMVVVVVFLAVLYYVSTQLDEGDAPPPPGVNAPGQR